MSQRFGVRRLKLRSLRVVVPVMLAAMAAAPSCAYADRLDGLNRQQLETEKLREEIRSLQGDHSVWSSVPAYAGVLTGLAAVVGLLITFRGQLNQRHVETLRRINEDFARAVTNLGSENPSLQASGAASLVTFLRPAPAEYAELRDPTFWLLIAQLRLDHPRPLAQLLVRTFERALRLQLSSRATDEPFDLSRCRLDRADLSGLDLSQADVAFASLDHANLRDATLNNLSGFAVKLDRATLTGAKLKEARLRRAQAPKAHFHNAILSSARLEEACLEGAEFQGAHLDAVHFDDANLIGASFESAEVQDARFRNVVFDDRALRSLSKAKGWERAHLDAHDREMVETFAAQRRQRTVPPEASLPKDRRR